MLCCGSRILRFKVTIFNIGMACAGKTIQTVGFLHQLRTMDTTRLLGPYLIIAPLSLIVQWQNEVQLWSPDMNCVVLHGNTEARDLIHKHEFYYSEPFIEKSQVSSYKRRGVYKFDILLTTYETAMKDIKLISHIPWKVMIVDEAHRLKNPASKVFELLQTIQHEHCVLLTGTPLQNKTEELWALMHFADRTKFNKQADFLAKFGDLKDAKHVGELHSVLKPFLLRRIKEDVEKSLPPKQETIVEVAHIMLFCSPHCSLLVLLFLWD